jgi:hypothetical protein
MEQVSEGGTTGEVMDEGSSAAVNRLGSLHGPARSLRKWYCGLRMMNNGNRR